MSNPRRPNSSDSEDIFESARPNSLERVEKSQAPSEFILDDEDILPENVAAAPKPALVPAPVEEDFSPPEEDRPVSRPRAMAALPSAQQRVPGKLDFVGKIIVWTLLPALFFGIFYAILKKQPASGVRVVKSKPSLPIEGSLVKITEISSGWRDRKEGDRVSAEAQAITKATVYPTKLPELHLKLSSSAPNAFLRVLFLNSDGKIAGDPRVVKVVDGKLQSTDKNDQILDGNECVLLASTGLQTGMHLVDYLAGNQTRWSVELSESSNYQAKGDDWKLLDTFSIADTKL